MRREHASGVTRVNIFTHNGAPQALVGCLAGALFRPLMPRPCFSDRLVT